MYSSSGLLESIGWFPDGASLNEADLTKPDREASGYVERVLNRPQDVQTRGGCLPWQYQSVTWKFEPKRSLWSRMRGTVANGPGVSRILEPTVANGPVNYNSLLGA